MEMEMIGMNCSFDGVLVFDVYFKMTRNGALPLASLTVVVEDRAGKTFVTRVNQFGERARGILTKGQRVHVEGTVALNTWTGKDGVEKSGLLVTATMVRPI